MQLWHSSFWHSPISVLPAEHKNGYRFCCATISAHVPTPSSSIADKGGAVWGSVKMWLSHVFFNAPLPNQSWKKKTNTLAVRRKGSKLIMLITLHIVFNLTLGNQEDRKEYEEDTSKSSIALLSDHRLGWDDHQLNFLKSPTHYTCKIICKSRVYILFLPPMLMNDVPVQTNGTPRFTGKPTVWEINRRNQGELHGTMQVNTGSVSFPADFIEPFCKVRMAFISSGSKEAQYEYSSFTGMPSWISDRVTLSAVEKTEVVYLTMLIDRSAQCFSILVKEQNLLTGKTMYVN